MRPVARPFVTGVGLPAAGRQRGYLDPAPHDSQTESVSPAVGFLGEPRTGDCPAAGFAA
jgi:hypothetical protein